MVVGNIHAPLVFFNHDVGTTSRVLHLDVHATVTGTRVRQSLPSVDVRRGVHEDNEQESEDDLASNFKLNLKLRLERHERC